MIGYNNYNRGYSKLFTQVNFVQLPLMALGGLNRITAHLCG